MLFLCVLCANFVFFVSFFPLKQLKEIFICLLFSGNYYEFGIGKAYQKKGTARKEFRFILSIQFFPVTYLFFEFFNHKLSVYENQKANIVQSNRKVVASGIPSFFIAFIPGYGAGCCSAWACSEY